MKNTNGYRWQYRPNHPLAMSNGCVYTHRLVAADKFGLEAVKDESVHVHHIDGDITNNDPANLELLTAGAHQRHHRGGRQTHRCPHCGSSFMAPPSDNRTYCGTGCRQRAQERIDWPPVEELKQRAEDTSFLALARKLGVSDNAIRKRIKNHS